MANLIFDNEKSFAPKDFFQHVGATKLEIVKNPNTDKLFFKTDGANPVSGAITTSKTLDEILGNPQVSWVKSEDTNSEFWLLHTKSNENVVHVISM